MPSVRDIIVLVRRVSADPTRVKRTAGRWNGRGGQVAGRPGKRSIKLGDVARDLGCIPKLPMPPMNVKVPYDVLREYNINNCKVTTDVWYKSKLDAAIPVLSITMGAHVYDVVRLVTGYMGACMLATFAHSRHSTIDWGKCTDAREYHGGMVFDPVTGIHRNVEVYDFKLMYPSVIMSCNISSETIL